MAITLKQVWKNKINIHIFFETLYFL